jgi:hypothetical protein
MTWLISGVELWHRFGRQTPSTRSSQRKLDVADKMTLPLDSVVRSSERRCGSAAHSDAKNKHSQEEEKAN